MESQAGFVIDPGFLFRITAIFSLVAGTMFLMWLGERITERGLGNGISIIIFAGIAAACLQAIGGMLELTRTGAFSIPVALSYLCRRNIGYCLRRLCRKRAKENTC